MEAGPQVLRPGCGTWRFLFVGNMEVAGVNQSGGRLAGFFLLGNTGVLLTCGYAPEK